MMNLLKVSHKLCKINWNSQKKIEQSLIFNIFLSLINNRLYKKMLIHAIFCLNSLAIVLLKNQRHLPLNN